MELVAELPPSHLWERAGIAELGAYLDWAEGQGARELLWTPEPDRLPALRAALARRSLTLVPILPNMSLYARDAMDAGPTGAVKRRLAALGPAALARLGLRLLPRLPSLAAKRFAAGVLLLADAEFLRLGLPVRRAALHASAVDLALALGGRELFDEFRAWASLRGVEPVFATHNLGLWTTRRPADALVAAPVNERGWLMQPSRAEGEAALRAGRVLATQVLPGGGDWPAAKARLEALGAAGAVLPWEAFRPSTPAERLSRWRERAAP